MQTTQLLVPAHGRDILTKQVSVFQQIVLSVQSIQIEIVVVLIITPLTLLITAHQVVLLMLLSFQLTINTQDTNVLAHINGILMVLVSVMKHVI